jgi:hypothetical protein
MSMQQKIYIKESLILSLPVQDDIYNSSLWSLVYSDKGHKIVIVIKYSITGLHL